MTPAALVDALSAIRLEGVFNPYSERCSIYDRSDAPRRRRDNLRAFVEAVLHVGVDSIWIARDLGYRGGRRTGLPLTDEVHLPIMSSLYGGLPLRRATVGPAMAERTAAIVWQLLARIDRPVFLWNVFPLHPHEAGEPFSNRCHTRQERAVCEELFIALLEMLAPTKIVAIGRDSAKALEKLHLRSYSVRHPSYGGQSDFIRGVSQFYEVREPDPFDKNALGSLFGGLQAVSTAARA
jgi:Uracil DNA glycosylase superfamily